MVLMSPERFWAEVAPWQIVPDARFPSPQAPVLVDSCAVTVSLENSCNILGMYSCICDILPRDAPVLLWPRGGKWNLPGTPIGFHPFGPSVAAVCRAVGMPQDAGALMFSSSERELLKGIVYLRMGVITHVEDELFMIPKGGDPLLWFDSDQNVLISSRNESLLGIILKAKGDMKAQMGHDSNK